MLFARSDSSHIIGVTAAFAIVATAVLATGIEAAMLTDASLQICGDAIDVEFGKGTFDLPQKALLDRVAQAASAVAIYYGRLPADHYRIVLVPIAGRRGVLGGTTWGRGGAHSRILIGEHTAIADLNGDWIMTHEMVHTAFPTMSPEHHWIEEGIATYVEPLARSWIGDYPPKKVWADLVVGLPKGTPAADDKGLDSTQTWGRTYWGGAMFCMLADVQIRLRTGGKHGLIDALRGILGASGGIQSEWPIARAFKAGDEAVGVPVLEELYAQMKSTPISPDLGALWRRLGVETNRDDPELDDLAPEAWIRRAISAPPTDQTKHCGAVL